MSKVQDFSIDYPVDEDHVFNYNQETGMLTERIVVSSGDKISKATLNYNLKTGYVVVDKDVKAKAE